MEPFTINIRITSKPADFVSVKTEELEAEGLYGLFELRVGEIVYGTFLEEVADKLHPQDDLYYWINVMLEAVVQISADRYCLIRDIEHPSRWLEFICWESEVEIMVIDINEVPSFSISLFVTNEKPTRKTVILELGTVLKDQIINTVLSTSKKFIQDVLVIEPRFTETAQHKQIVKLIAQINERYMNL